MKHVKKSISITGEVDRFISERLENTQEFKGYSDAADFFLKKGIAAYAAERAENVG